MPSFEDIVIENFVEIQRNFKSGLINKGYSYDEDLFNDAFISCRNTLSDKELTITDIIAIIKTVIDIIKITYFISEKLLSKK